MKRTIEEILKKYKDPRLTSKSWSKVINEYYNTTIDASDVHSIFKNLRIPCIEKEVRGGIIDSYLIKAVLPFIYNGFIIKIIDSWSTKKEENAVDNKAVNKTVPVPYYISTMHKRKEEDGLEWKNNENDMEKFSDYLINNTYQFESVVKRNVFITETQLKRLSEDLENEGRNITNRKAYKEKVQPLIDTLGKKIYGDKLGTINQEKTSQFGLDNNPVMNDIQLKTGLFSLGNAKLSDDTLIINFTSALQCPSVTVCPVTQKACYAVAGELRLPAVRRKNLMVQNMWINALKNDAIGEVFGIAQMYIEILKNTKKPIKYIRFNEAGDFINQKILDGAALFAKTIRDKYGVLSMAYTAKNNLDFTKEIDGEPIDKIIKINASRLDIKLSDDSTHNKFLATPMNFKDALVENDKVVSVTEAEIKKNQLKCHGVVKSDISIPILENGKWDGGQGYYYVCPCSFWSFNKYKAALRQLKLMKIIDAKEEYLSNKEINNIINTLSEEQKSIIKKETNKIKSPCGVQCAVCHNMSGGIDIKDFKNYPNCKKIKDYTVLEATHGNTSDRYKADYANAKRKGDDSVSYEKRNKYGLVTKYRKNK